jgi:acyl-CoA dehydrogenase
VRSTDREYRFDPYLDALSDDWYADDDVLQRLLDRYTADTDRSRLADWGPLVAGRLRELAEESARPENAPRLRGRDAWGRREDAIALPGSTREALSVAHGGASLGAVHGDPFVHYAMVYLLAQNGEAGVACSVACTDGLVRALDALGDRPVHAEVVAAVRGATVDDYVHGAQFVTEIQGGSDVPSNTVRAEPDGETFRIHGQKWFCSNINADWFLVTARPGGGADLGLFLVPAGGGYTIHRLKDKLGTRELATAEVTFEGAVGHPVGSPERGLANLLRYVLTPSRFACVLFAAGALRRAERIVRAYAGFREAFGRPIADYPLVARTLAEISAARVAALGCAFELLRLWRAAEAADHRGREAADFRVLLSLAKPVLTRAATHRLHDAMMVLGGNGIEERFSPLPRLYRDSVIMETWEGPHNVLFEQALRDMARFDVDPAGLVERLTGAPLSDVVDGLADALDVSGEAPGGQARLRPRPDGAMAVAAAAPLLVTAVGEAAAAR